MQRRRSAGSVAEEDALELLETLLTRGSGDKGRLLREYLLLLAKLSEGDASLLERKTRVGTVLADQHPQALAAAIGGVGRVCVCMRARMGKRILTSPS